MTSLQTAPAQPETIDEAMITPVFTVLAETAAQAVGTSPAPPALPEGFDAAMAQMLGQACLSAYLQYTQQGSPIDLSQLPLVNGAASYIQLGDAFTTTEPIGPPSATSPMPGSSAYANVTFGFAFQAQDEQGDAVYNVIVFRGTQSYEEWVSDADALPAQFSLAPKLGPVQKPMLVHDGIAAVYNAGGQDPPASGSLAGQVRAILALDDFDSKVPLYVTGHSLGGGLAELCAADVGSLKPLLGKPAAQSVYLYSLASPQVAVGITTSLVIAGQPVEMPASLFPAQVVESCTGAFRIVNAADLVPVLPFGATGSGGWGVEFAPAIPPSNTVSFLVQTGDVLSNHACGLYCGFLNQLVTA